MIELLRWWSARSSLGPLLRMRALLLGVVAVACVASAAPEALPPTLETMIELRKIEAAGYHPGDVDTYRLKYQDLARQRPAEVMPRVYVAWCTLPSDDAWNQLKAISTIFPDHPWVRYGMGRIYTTWKGMSDLARTEFEAVLKRDPKFFPAIIGLGDVARVKKDWALAEEKYRAALAISDDPFAHAGLGLTLAAQNKNDAALVELKKAIAQQPEQPAALATLIKLSTELKDPEAVVAAQALADLRPKDRDARRMLADLRFERGEKDVAVKEYERLIRLGADGEIYRRVATLYRELGDTDGEERTLQSLAAMEDKSTEHNLRLAEIKLARKDYEGAEGQWLEVLARDPKKLEARENLAKLKLELGQPHLALEEYRLGLAAAPTDARFVEAVAKLEKDFKLPRTPPKGKTVNHVFWAVQWTLGKFYDERRAANPALEGKFKLKARVSADGKATQIDVVEDTLKDPLLLAHAYFGLRDAEYPKQKVEPVFEFELGGKKKKGK